MSELDIIARILKSDLPIEMKREQLIAIIGTGDFTLPELNAQQSLLVKKWLRFRLSNKKMNFSATERRRMSEIRTKIETLIAEKDAAILRAAHAEIILSLLQFSKIKGKMKFSQKNSEEDLTD